MAWRMMVPSGGNGAEWKVIAWDWTNAWTVSILIKQSIVGCLLLGRCALLHIWSYSAHV